MKTLLGVCAALAVALPAFAAPAVGDPTALVRKLYAEAAASKTEGDPLWWSYLTGRAQSTFAAVLAAEKKSGDELIDADFLCQCQDADGLKITSLTLSNQTPTRVIAHVSLVYGDKSRTKLALEFVKVGPGWKIAEMTDKDGHTFTAENVAALKSGG